MSETGLSPMMRQYMRIKEQNPDKILFFRLGDFYEMFYDDAKISSEELNLALTGKDCGADERAPMCGVPYHSCEGYIARLVERGYKVAICEQMEDPATAKGLVKREIVRVITPGTVVEDTMLDEGKNNYLAAVSLRENGAGVCFADISTGTAKVTCFHGRRYDGDLTAELSRYSPREVIIAEGDENHPVAVFARETLGVHTETVECGFFDETATAAAVRDYFSDGDLPRKRFNAMDPYCRSALGAAVCYLKNTRRYSQAGISDIEVYESGRYMRLDLTALRNLELCETLRGEKRGSLLWAIDKTRTPMGRRLIRSWLERPLTDPEEINARLDAVEEFTGDTVLRSEAREYLTGVRDMERLTARISGGTATARELVALKDALTRLPYIKSVLRPCKSSLLRGIDGDIDPLDGLAGKIGATIVDDPPLSVREGDMIRPGYSEELDALRGDLNGGKGYLVELEKREKERTGIKNLKVRYNRVFGYYIEVSNSFLNQVPENYVRKQTLTGGERFITDELKDLEARILGAKERGERLEYEIFVSLCREVADRYREIQKTAEAVAALDVLASFAETSAVNGYVRPACNTEGRIEITAGRHPVVELMSKTPFVPNDTLLDMGENRCAIITGPNMAGKSTYMRQVAIICIMAQIGCFVPAKSADISIGDAVYTRVGASDDLASGKSTFMVEMSEVAQIVKNATKNSLLIFDEIGRGTSTYDGMAIARAVVEYAASTKTLGAKTLFATHYHELTRLEGSIDGVKNYNIAAEKNGDDIVFLRRIVRGGADESYGVEVAALSGIPAAIIRRARAILAELESGENAAAPAGGNDYGEIAPSPAEDFAREIRKIDINTVTPLEALSVLSGLVEEAKELQI